MYELRINTSQFENKNRRDWENQLYNDICVKLNGLQWEYKHKSGLKDRFEAIQGKGHNINIYSENNQITLKDERYGTQKVRKGLPGICTGYVSWEKIETQLDKNGYVRIPFTNFYDTRALKKSLGLDKCYVEIRKINEEKQVITKPVFIGVDANKVPLYVRKHSEFIGIAKKGIYYFVIFKHGEDDYSYWQTDYIYDENSGGSTRGSKAEVIEELCENLSLDMVRRLIK